MLDGKTKRNNSIYKGNSDALKVQNIFKSSEQVKTASASSDIQPLNFGLPVQGPFRIARSPIQIK